jgi:hypothetical protein
MRVRKQHGQIELPFFKFGEQRLAEFAQAGAGIQNNDVRAAADFDARGVAAVTNGIFSRRRHGTADAPKFYLSNTFDTSTLRQRPAKIKLKIFNGSARRLRRPSQRFFTVAVITKPETIFNFTAHFYLISHA